MKSDSKSQRRGDKVPSAPSPEYSKSQRRGDAPSPEYKAPDLTSSLFRDTSTNLILGFQAFVLVLIVHGAGVILADEGQVAATRAAQLLGSSD